LNELLEIQTLTNAKTKLNLSNYVTIFQSYTFYFLETSEILQGTN